jgi:hypothetical protein
MNGRNLRRSAGLAGTVAAAAAGALTVGLVSGVVHTSTQAQGSATTNTGTTNTGTTNTGTTNTSRNSDDDETNSSNTSNRSNSTSGIGSTSQQAQPVAKSNGS